MDLFETTTIVNENIFKELKYIMSTAQKMIFMTFLSFSVIGLVLCAISELYQEVIIITIMTIIFILVCMIILNNQRKANIKRLEESVHSDEYTETTSFTETGFKIINNATGGMKTIYYENIVRFVETKNFYAIITKGKQIGLINKIVIEENGKKEELINFLRLKCLNIKFTIKKHS